MPGTSATIPVHVLTGFLGSGKTTLLNKLIRHEMFADAAIIINEFGEIGLDHHLVEASDDAIIELANGCLCCTVRGQLVETLEDLVERNPARIIIETTGLADPGPVLQALMGSPRLKGVVRFAGLLTVHDVANGMARLSGKREALLQLQLADQVIFSKLDVVPAERRDETHKKAAAEVRALNPDAILLTADELINDPALALSGQARSLPEPEAGHHHHHHYHDISIHNDAISALTLTHDAPIEPAQLSMFLDLLLSAHGDHIIRLKGLANIKGEEHPVVVQAVGRVLSEFTHLPAWPNGDHHTRLVVFVEDMDRNFVRKLFDGFMNIPAVDTPDRMALDENPLAIPGMGSATFKR